MLLLFGCQTRPGEQDHSADTTETGAAPERYAIESEEDARIVLQTPLSSGDAMWTGYYHAVPQGEERLPHGSFQAVAERPVPDFPDTPIRTTYEGQFREGVPYGAFEARVEAPEAETHYTLLYDEDGSCTEGIVEQRGEGQAIERVIARPRPCSFQTLRDSVYAR